MTDENWIQWKHLDEKRYWSKQFKNVDIKDKS